ncbi:MAG: hypothetical protein LBC35_00805 [Coriobacteriales bacterium]|jgi:hypothetical protein|nr:hypothetical protein [Coriobacteriales bacterium]
MLPEQIGVTLDIAIAVIVGILGGALGIVPFVVARARIRAKMRKDGTAGIITGMAATLISFVVMAAEIVVCRLLAASYLLPFSISAVAFFIIAMMVYTATLVRR